MYTKNPTVDRLNRYLPFDPGHDQIYEESASSSDSFNIETRAFDYLKRICTEDANAIVLTGDAGHGKTHLCRRLIESFCLSEGLDKAEREDQSREIINKQCDGLTQIPANTQGSRTYFRIFKDFSELTIEVAARSLEEALTDSESITILCANEGRLRAALSSPDAGPRGKKIRERFAQSFEDGLCSSADQIHVLNLNYQSVAAETANESLFKSAFKVWLDGRRWQGCEGCEKNKRCPILRNRQMIDGRDDGLGNNRLEQLNLLFKTLERTDTVITIREMLMLVAYLLTGGLNCEVVHKRSSEGGWARKYAFYTLLFEKPDSLSREQLASIKTLERLKRIDPGLMASRKTDESLINEEELFPANQLDLEFSASSHNVPIRMDAAKGIDQILVTASSKKERTAESILARDIVRTLRRRAFFDGVAEKEDALARLGFRYGSLFNRVITEQLSISEMMELKTSVVSGLKHIQGIRIGGGSASLTLLDPAFGRMGANGGILAGSIGPNFINLIPLEKKWNLPDNADALYNSVDWLSREIALQIIADHGQEPRFLSMDLSMFECLMRASHGHVPIKFYENDVRKFLDFLSDIAEKLVARVDSITVLNDTGQYLVTLDDKDGVVFVDRA